jgi:hypothetical protein
LLSKFSCCRLLRLWFLLVFDVSRHGHICISHHYRSTVLMVMVLDIRYYCTMRKLVVCTVSDGTTMVILLLRLRFSLLPFFLNNICRTPNDTELRRLSHHHQHCCGTKIRTFPDGVARWLTIRRESRFLLRFDRNCIERTLRASSRFWSMALVALYRDTNRGRIEIDV